MATGQSGPKVTKAWPAKRDLSSYQYHEMTLDTDGYIDYCDTSAGTIPLGILQNKPEAAGEEAEIALPGSVSLMAVNAGTDITQMDFLGSGNDYHGVKVSGDDALYGAIALEDATEDEDIIEVLVVGPSYISGAGDD